MKIEDLRFIATGVPAFILILVGYFLEILSVVGLVWWTISGVAIFLISNLLRKRYSLHFDYYGRAMFHISAGVIIVFHGWYYTQETAILLTSTLLVIFIINLFLEKRNIITTFTFSKEAITNRSSHYLSGTYWLTSSLAVLFIFPAPIAFASIFALAFGDSAAGLTGRFIGRTRNPLNKKKTVEGTIACFFASFICMLFFIDAHVALLAGLAVALIELLPLNDNLVIPPFAALIISIISV